MIHGVPPPYGCFPLNSLQVEGPKFGTMLPSMEGNSKNGCIFSPHNVIKYSTTQPLVEDNIPRFIRWHHYEHDLHLVS